MSGYTFQQVRLRNNLAKLPAKCVAVHPDGNRLIVLEAGEAGYKVPLNGPPEGTVTAVLRTEVDRINGNAGVTRRQEAAMIAGSMFGFWSKLADPDEYDEQGRLKQ